VISRISYRPDRVHCIKTFVGCIPFVFSPGPGDYAFTPHHRVSVRGTLFRTNRKFENMKKILLIDDDTEFSQAVGTVLRRAGYEVVHAADGRKGLVFYLKDGFDLVISDILMPDVDGVEVILAIRKLDAHLPIIAMSGGGLAQPETYLKIARACGGNAFLIKPFDPAFLIEQVARAITPAQLVHA